MHKTPNNQLSAFVLTFILFIQCYPTSAAAPTKEKRPEVIIKLECVPAEKANTSTALKLRTRVYNINITKQTVVELDEDGEATEPLETQVLNENVIAAHGLRYGGDFFDIRKDPEGLKKFHIESRRIIRIDRISGSYRREAWPELTSTGMPVEAEDSVYLRQDIPSFFCSSCYPALLRGREAGVCRLSKPAF